MPIVNIESSYFYIEGENYKIFDIINRNSSIVKRCDIEKKVSSCQGVTATRKKNSINKKIKLL